MTKLDTTFGISGSIPDGARAAWGGRAIDYGTSFDLPWDRADMAGDAAGKLTLGELLTERTPLTQVFKNLADMPKGDTVAEVYADEDATMVARRNGGYLYLQAWLNPKETDG